MENNKRTANHVIVDEASKICNDTALTNPDAARETLDWIYKQQIEKEVMFGGEPVPTLLRPNFISDAQTDTLIYVSGVIMNVLEKVVKLYFESDVLHGVIRLSPLEKEMVSIDPRVERVVVKSRLDAFMQGDTLKFLEFNCDSPAGIAYGEVQGEIFSGTDVMKEISGKFDVSQAERCRMMLDALVQAYREFGGKKEKPHIAITDWRDVKTIHEFHMLKRFFEALGYPTTVCDPRDFELEGDTLRVGGGAPVDVVYRRVIIREVLEKENEVSAFLDAYRRGLVCVANSFRTKIVSNKSTLAVMTDPRFDGLFTDEENKIKYRHVPWTRNLLPGKVVYNEKEYDPFDLAASRKDAFVIKPADGYGGKDVFIGMETSTADWEATINKAVQGEGVWVLQEFVPIPEEDFPILDDGVTLKKRKVNLNPFAIGGRYAGCISRISVFPIINVSAGGGMVPTFTVSPKS